MAVLSVVEIPIEGVRQVEPNTEMYLKKTLMGKGTLYITERAVTWIGGSENRLKIPFLNIVLHAVSRDPALFPKGCIYLHTDARLPFAVPVAPNVEEDPYENFANAAPMLSELYFVPEDDTRLSPLFQTMCDCQSLNPDPQQPIAIVEDFAFVVADEDGAIENEEEFDHGSDNGNAEDDAVHNAQDEAEEEVPDQ